MYRTCCLGRTWLPLLGLVLVFAAPCAPAVPLLPSQGPQRLSGTTAAARPELAGVVEEDMLRPYAFQGAGSSASGVIHNRVVRAVDGTLDFYWRIIPDASSTGDITSFRVGGFRGFVRDGDFRLDDVGSVGPDIALRSLDQDNREGDGVNFLFSDGVSAGESSFFFFLDTQATAFSDTGGRYDFVLSGAVNFDGISPLFTTFAPALTLGTKQVTVGLTILQRNNIPLENLAVSTFLSEDILATGETTASVTVADVTDRCIICLTFLDR